MDHIRMPGFSGFTPKVYAAQPREPLQDPHALNGHAMQGRCIVANGVITVYSVYPAQFK